MEAGVGEPLLEDNNSNDKLDEDMEEMEAEGSEVSEVRSESVPDPFSLRTTPNSIISITETDEENFGDTIDLTKDVDLDESVMIVERCLREDTYKVLRIMQGEKGPPRSFDEVYAYLEAHITKHNRVQIVVEEFVGMNSDECGSRTPTPDLRAQEPDQETSQLQFRGKGKGVGKNSSTFRPVKSHPPTPDASPEASTSTIVSPVAVAMKRNISHGDTDEDEALKKVKVESDVTTDGVKVKKEIRSGYSIPVKKEKPARGEPITADMLYGPFDFKQHRSESSKGSRRTKNLPDALQDIVEDATKKSKFCLTPPRLNRLASAPAVDPDDPDTPEFVADTTSRSSSTEKREYIKPSRFGSESPISIPGSPIANPSSQIIHPAKINLENHSAAARQRTPSIEVMQEIVPVRNDPGDVVEISDNDPADAAEVASLAENLVMMFPDTPITYIRQRCVDLVGRPAAIERFTEELLMDPKPPDNWEQIYKQPFHIPEPVNNPPPVAANQVPVEAVPLPPPLVPENAPVTAEPSVSVREVMEVSEEDNLAIAAALKDLNEKDVPQEPTPSSSSVQDSSSRPEVELDPITAWESDKNSVLLSVFPDICPDHLSSIVQKVRASLAPTATGEAAAGAETEANSSAVTAKISIPDLNREFAARVEELFAMKAEERRLLPTRAEWETKKKAKEELEKWSGNMSVNDMLLLYSGDPAGYFGNPDRNPESDLYKQHAIEGLKSEFRYHSINEIEKTFKKSKFLYMPAYKSLSAGKNTRKTKRPDQEVKFPSEHSIEFLKEKKFIELENDIKKEKDRRANERQMKIEEAKHQGLLQECLCCYSDDCLPEDMISCKGGHVYCRDCIARGTDVAIGDGKTVIECLGHCKEEIGWQELQKVVAPNVLSKLLQRRQAEEVGAAEMDNMVSCPFCPYVTIMDNPDDKVLVCRNPECGRDSCRLCQEPNHVPLRCNEVEKQDQEEERKKIEERLSEAMMRECWKCKVKYFKEEGCNKMTCPRPGCGAKMCYLCKAQVTDYTHFYGQGGVPDKKRTCPLWTDNKKLHEQEVAKEAAKAKEELKRKNIQLVHDPTAGLAEPAEGGNVGGNVAPDVGDVIAPGVPREILVRQQRQIEDMILHRGQGRVPPPGMPWIGGLQGGPVQLHGAPGMRDVVMEQMHEVIRMREQQRANMRLLRQREQQALRAFERANRVMAAPPAPVANPQAPLPPAPFQVFGNPQAVPEPLPFLDLVENHGRNIHIVQQQRMPFMAGPVHQVQQPFAPQPPRMVPAPPPVQPLHQQPLPQRHMQGLPPAAGVQRDQQQMGRQQLPGQDHFARYQNIRQRQMTEAQRERERRNRDEAMMRLRRNRDEVLRRQRRSRERFDERHRERRHERNEAERQVQEADRRDRMAQLARANSGPRVQRMRAGEVRVERVPNTFQEAPQGAQEARPRPVTPGQEEAAQVQRDGGEQRDRDFNFQVILDM